MNKKKNKKKKSEKRIFIKLFLCLIYLIAMTVLSVCAYKIFQEKEEIKPWEKITNADEYSYIEVSRMSEKFAYYSTSKKSIHFVIEKEDTGAWHTYLISINNSDYSKFKDIIDYTYERTTKEPAPIKVYGYPVVINAELKALAIKNLPNFMPTENEIVINEENFDTYLTNSYLDTTIARTDTFSVPLFIILLMIFVLLGLFIFTIFDKDKIVDDVDDIIDDVLKKYTKPKTEKKES